MQLCVMSILVNILTALLLAKKYSNLLSARGETRSDIIFFSPHRNATEWCGPVCLPSSALSCFGQSASFLPQLVLLVMRHSPYTVNTLWVL